MPLPFLRPQKKDAAVIIETKKPDSGAEMNLDGAGDEGLRAAAADMIRAIGMKDDKMLAAAIRAAFEILESQPHEEAASIEE